MKRIIILILLCFLFAGCKHEIEHYVALSVVDDDNTAYNQNPKDPLILSKVDAEMTFNILLIPEANDLITITNIYSSDPKILLIESVNTEEKTIKAKALKAGKVKIYLYTKKHGNASSLPIVVN